MDFKQNYFEMFGVDVSFSVDLKVISEKYLELQKASHPDNFATVSAAEQRLSVQSSSHINTAYQVMKSPLLRAEYLLELSGHPLNSDTMTVKDGQFLFSQMELRESLAELSDGIKTGSIDAVAATEKLEKFSDNAVEARNELIASFGVAYLDEQFLVAQQLTAKLHFVEKMLLEIERVEDNLLV